MSFISRLFIYQSVIVYCLVSLFSEFTKQSSEFKDSLYLLSKNTKLTGLDGLIENYSSVLLTSLLSVELLFSIFALLGCRMFGFFNAFIVLFHGIVRYNPFNNSNTSSSKTTKFDLYDYKTYFNHINYELLLVVGVCLSMLVSSTNNVNSYNLQPNTNEISNEDKGKKVSHETINNNKVRSNSGGKNKKKMD